MTKKSKACPNCGANTGLDKVQCGVCNDRARSGRPPRTIAEREATQTRLSIRDDFRSKASNSEAFALFGPEPQAQQAAVAFLFKPQRKFAPILAFRFYKADNNYIHVWLGSNDKAFFTYWLKDQRLPINPEWIVESTVTISGKDRKLFVLDSYGKNVNLIAQSLQAGGVLNRSNPATLQQVQDLLNAPKKAYAASRSQARKQYQSQVLTRDNRECVACQASHELEIAHLVPRAAGLKKGLALEQLDDEQNLVTLCRACHTAFDNLFVHSGDPKLNEQIKKLSEAVANYYKQIIMSELVELLVHRNFKPQILTISDLIDRKLLTLDEEEYFSSLSELSNEYPQAELTHAEGHTPLMVSILDSWLVFYDLSPEKTDGKAVLELTNRLWQELLDKHSSQQESLEAELAKLRQLRLTERKQRAVDVEALLAPRRTALLELWSSSDLE